MHIRQAGTRRSLLHGNLIAATTPPRAQFTDILQAQCQKDLKGLSKQIESKQGDLEVAHKQLQQQQKTEAALQKRISEAERRLQVQGRLWFCCKSAHAHAQYWTDCCCFGSPDTGVVTLPT